jgi:hypothetical protein
VIHPNWTPDEAYELGKAAGYAEAYGHLLMLVGLLGAVYWGWQLVNLRRRLRR